MKDPKGKWIVANTNYMWAPGTNRTRLIPRAEPSPRPWVVLSTDPTLWHRRADFVTFDEAILYLEEVTTYYLDA